MSVKPVRLSSTSFVVLGLVELLGEATPYDLQRTLEKSVENFWPVPHTTFYAEPARLARAGYLTERQEAGGRRRKLYAITDLGEEALRDWTHAPGAPPPQLRDAGTLKIFFGADPVPIFTERRDWHRAKLAELEGYLENMGPTDGHDGVRLALLAGISYHRQLLEAVEGYLASAPAGAAGSRSS